MQNLEQKTITMSSLSNAIYNNNGELVDTLISGIIATAQEDQPIAPQLESALLSAAEAGSDRALLVLLRAGANPNCCDSMCLF